MDSTGVNGTCWSREMTSACTTFLQREGQRKLITVVLTEA